MKLYFINQQSSHWINAWERGRVEAEKQPVFAMSVTLDYTKKKCTYKNVCIFSGHSQWCLNMALILC